MKPKVIYVNPGTMLEVRHVHHEFEPNAAGWKEQFYHFKDLFQINGVHEITPALPNFRVNSWKDWKSEPPETMTIPDEVAAAVAAERERCARIVETGLGRTNTTIARMIREGGA